MPELRTRRIPERQKHCTLRLIVEQYPERGRCVYTHTCNCFVDYTKAFDSVWHEGLLAVLPSLGVPLKLATLLQNLYAQSQLAANIGAIFDKWFTASGWSGFVKQGGLTWRTLVGANPIPIPTPLIWRYLGIKLLQGAQMGAGGWPPPHLAPSL